MEYHAPTGQFTVSSNSLGKATHELMYALAGVRKMNNLPLTPYERNGCLEPVDHIQKAIVDGARTMGINLGGNWGNEIDLSKYKD